MVTYVENSVQIIEIRILLCTKFFKDKINIALSKFELICKPVKVIVIAAVHHDGDANLNSQTKDVK